MLRTNGALETNCGVFGAMAHQSYLTGGSDPENIDISNSRAAIP